MNRLCSKIGFRSFSSLCCVESKALHRLAKSGITGESHQAFVSSLACFESDFDNTTLESSLRCLKSLQISSGKVSKAPSVSTADLVLMDLKRQLHILSPAQLTDVLCFLGAFQYRRSLMLGVSSFLPRFIRSLEELSVRQLTLGMWSVSRADPALLSELAPAILSHLDSNPAKLAVMSSRDQALFLSSIMSAVSHAAAPKLFLESVIAFLPSLGLKAGSLGVQESAMVLLATARLKDTSRKLGVDPGLVDGIIHDSVVRLHALLRTGRPSTESLLTTAWALALLRFRSQPVLADVYRALYARADQLTENQAAFSLFLFATCSGLRDDVIFDALLNRVLGRSHVLSNQNLINLGIVVKKLNREQIFFEVFALVDQRASALKPAQLVTASSFTDVSPHIMGRMQEFKLSEVIRLLAVGGEGEFQWALQRELIERLKQKEDCGGADLLLLAREIRRLGARVKPNLRVRFNTRLVRAVEQRRIPTNLLLTNLKLIDDLGSWHCLPFATQTKLWAKATELQRIDVRYPLDMTASDPVEVRRRRLTTKRLIVRVGEPKAEPVEKRAARVKSNRKAIEEEIELEEVGEGITPIAKFIDTVRRHSAA